MHGSSDKRFAEAKPVHPHQWLWEPLEADPSFVIRPMFGTKAVYLEGRLMLCFCNRREPWRGVLVCTDRERQSALRVEFTALAPHPVLPKWLYLPESAETFESTAARVVALVGRRDPRIGIVPPARKKRSGAATRERRP